jgi:hypothetical protein
MSTLVDGFVDAQAMHEAYPQSFEAPSAAEIAAVVPGDSVKVCDGGERFWVTVVSGTPAAPAFDRVFTGRVDNELISGQSYNLGSLITFRGFHIYQIFEE